MTDDNHFQFKFDDNVNSILQSIFHAPVIQEEPAGDGSSHAASVKFMITLRDEQLLRELGYSQEQIDAMKPEEASEILAIGTRAVETEAG